MNFLWENIFRRQRKEDSVLTILRENILFQDLTERELKFIEEIVHIRKFHPGEPVFRQGEVGVGMYIIVTGRIEIFISDSNYPNEPSRDMFITQLTRGDFFGEISLVEENGRRTASALARDESLLIGFFKPDLQEILSRNPLTGVKIITRLAEVLGRRLKETTDKVSELRQALKDLREPSSLESHDGSKAASSTSA